MIPEHDQHRLQELEALIRLRGDHPSIDGSVRRRLAETLVMTLGPVTTTEAGELVPSDLVTITVHDEPPQHFVPVFTDVVHVARAVEHQAEWATLHVLAVPGSVLVEMLPGGVGIVSPGPGPRLVADPALHGAVERSTALEPSPRAPRSHPS